MYTRQRIGEIDFIKSILILLMITFHLVYFGEMYPHAKAFVYTFHMQAFLVIAGCLVNFNKTWRAFFKTMLWIFIPYAIMECGYTVMASILPINEHINNLTATLLIDKIIVHPIGPYWFLHTLLLCHITTYMIFRLHNIPILSRFILLWLCFFTFNLLQIASLTYCCYYLAGLVINNSKINFLQIFRPSWTAIIPVAIIAICYNDYSKSAIMCASILYLMLCLFLFIYGVIPEHLRRLNVFIGQNTLLLLLFSPIFTILAKRFIPFLDFDKQVCCF